MSIKKRILYKIVQWLIFRYFDNGITPIYGTNEMASQIIAYKWCFYDSEYEKYND